MIQILYSLCHGHSIIVTQLQNKGAMYNCSQSVALLQYQPHYSRKQSPWSYLDWLIYPVGSSKSLLEPVLFVLFINNFQKELEST